MNICWFFKANVSVKSPVMLFSDKCLKLKVTVIMTSIIVWKASSMLALCWSLFCMHYYLSFLVLQSSWCGKVSKGANIRNRYNQVPHLNQDTYWKVTHSQLDTTNESEEVSPFAAGDHTAHINRRAHRHSQHKREHIKDPQKKYRLGTVSKIVYWRV